MTNQTNNPTTLTTITTVRLSQLALISRLRRYCFEETQTITMSELPVANSDTRSPQFRELSSKLHAIANNGHGSINAELREINSVISLAVDIGEIGAITLMYYRLEEINAEIIRSKYFK